MRNKIILLVEDNADDELLALRALGKGRISNSVFVTRDGAEALDFLFRRGKYANRPNDQEPQLVLLDLKLPKVDGLEVLRQIRANPATSQLPVVILTSSREEKDVVAGYGLGANSFVCKPVDLDQFTQAVQELQLYWLVLNESPPAAAGGARRT